MVEPGRHRTLSKSIAILCSLTFSSCAYVGLKKGLLIDQPSLKNHLIGEYQDLISVNIDPPLSVRFEPRALEYPLLVGPCLLIPAPIFPFIPAIVAAIKKRTDFEIPNEHLKVILEFAPGPFYFSRKYPNRRIKYDFTPQAVNLKIEDKLLSPISIESACSTISPWPYTTGYVRGKCNPEPNGLYSFFISSNTFENIPTFTLTFNIPASAIEGAELQIGNVTHEDQIVKAPPISIKRRRIFNLDCVL